MALSGKELEKEINKIKRLLEDDEKVILVTKQTRLGIAGGSLITPNTFFVTNKRIIVRNPKTLGLREDILVIPYEKITAIRMGKGILKGEITINAPGLTSEIHRFFRSKKVAEEIGIPGIPKEDAEMIVNYVQERIKEIKNQEKSSLQPIQPSPIDELKKLKELLDMGIITKEEFEEKKKELLSKI